MPHKLHVLVNNKHKLELRQVAKRPAVKNTDQGLKFLLRPEDNSIVSTRLFATADVINSNAQCHFFPHGNTNYFLFKVFRGSPAIKNTARSLLLAISAQQCLIF